MYCVAEMSTKDSIGNQQTLALPVLQYHFAPQELNCSYKESEVLLARKRMRWWVYHLQ